MMKGIIKREVSPGVSSLEVKRKTLSVFDLTDEDFKIATRTKGAWQMVTYDHIDGDDMLTLALMRIQGMPHEMLALGPTAIMAAGQEALQVAVERQGATVQ